MYEYMYICTYKSLYIYKIYITKFSKRYKGNSVEKQIVFSANGTERFGPHKNYNPQLIICVKFNSNSIILLNIKCKTYKTK